MSPARCLALCLALISAPAFADPTEPAIVAERDAQAARRAAESASRHVMSMLDRSRLDHDRDRTACFSNKLAQIDSFGRMIGDRHQRLRDALARGDQRDAEYHHAVIGRLLEQLRALEHGASSCLAPQQRPS
jgi:hypothetical protein